MMKKVAFHTLGCKVNQYETRKIADGFRAEGVAIAEDGEKADIYLINTCTVTNIADRKSRQFIRRARRANPDALVVATGCYAEINRYDLDKNDQIDMVFPNSDKAELVSKVVECLEHREGESSQSENEESKKADPHSLATGLTGLTDERSRSYIKVEDGCDRFCSYCIIPYARGKVRSRSSDDIVKEAETLIEAGKKELILVGINTALYGRDLRDRDIPKDSSGKYGLDIANLIGEILKLPGDFRVRLSSLEPTVINADQVKDLFTFDRLCHHLHLSLQSGSDRVLDKMKRRYSRNDYLDIVRTLRDFDPHYGITTDVIVGFPGETEEDLEDTMDLIRKAEFVRVHVFPYSVRSGTDAARMKGQISNKEKTERSRLLRECAEKVSLDFREKCRGDIARVLFTEVNGDYLTGYAGNYIKVYSDPGLQQAGKEKSTMLNRFAKVELVDIYKDGMKGVILDG